MRWDAQCALKRPHAWPISEPVLNLFKALHGLFRARDSVEWVRPPGEFGLTWILPLARAAARGPVIASGPSAARKKVGLNHTPGPNRPERGSPISEPVLNLFKLVGPAISNSVSSVFKEMRRHFRVSVNCRLWLSHRERPPDRYPGMRRSSRNEGHAKFARNPPRRQSPSINERAPASFPGVSRLGSARSYIQHFQSDEGKTYTNL